MSHKSKINRHKKSKFKKAQDKSINNYLKDVNINTGLILDMPISTSNNEFLTPNENFSVAEYFKEQSDTDLNMLKKIKIWLTRKLEYILS